MTDATAPAETEARLDPRVRRTRNDVLRTAVALLLDEGWESVTQPKVARAAGYSKATVYAHWPERTDLLRDAFSRFGDMPHHVPTGDVRADLVAELVSFRGAMAEHRLGRALAVLAERASAGIEVADIREAFIADGERTLRRVLGQVTDGPELEAAAFMLGGLVVHTVLLHGKAPSDEVIEAAVDTALGGLLRGSARPSAD